jgi:hypothetical protein
MKKMSHPINSEVYEKILNDEEFINKVWNSFDATTKIGILEKAGVDWLNEYVSVYGTGDEN